MDSQDKSSADWAREVEELQARLSEAEDTLNAIRHGEVDALLISTPGGERVYTLEGADRSYRILIESMQQGAATLLDDGTILYCNRYLARMLKTSLEKLIGSSIHAFVPPADARQFEALIEQGRHCSSQGELRFRTEDGALIPVYLAFNHLQLGETHALCLAVTDLTLTEAAERLAQANKLLKQENADRKRAERTLGKTNRLLEAQKEDLQAQAEELQSQAEELQTQTEELHAQSAEMQAANQELAKARAQLEAIVQQMPAGVIIAEAPSGWMVMANAAIERILRFPFNPANAAKLENLKTPHPYNWLIQDREHLMTRALMTGESVTGQEMQIIRGDGTEATLSASSAPIRDPEGRIIAAILVLEDITDRKKGEETLRKLNEQLAAADQRKDEFLAMLAHELRNPLAPIRNAVQVLRIVGTRDTVIQRQHGIIDRQVTHMARLLGDLLDVSRITRGKIELNRIPLHLSDAILHAIEISTPVIEARQHRLHLTPPPDGLRVEADVDRLAQVIGNLLTNAAKYTEEGGQIWLEAGREGNEAVVRVRDTGLGVESEMLPHMFDLFTQADHSVARSQGGLGIGLTLVKKLVELHGGRVEAHSEGLGKGSEFIVRLPALADEVQAGKPEVPEAIVETSPRRILVVDDIPDSAMSLSELLELWGHDVRAAYDGVGALETARAFLPEIVLLDIGMPGMDGYEVARHLREEANGNVLILVALTGYGQESDRQMTRDAGFDHHLVKPVDMNDLRKLLAAFTV